MLQEYAVASLVVVYVRRCHGVFVRIFRSSARDTRGVEPGCGGGAVADPHAYLSWQPTALPVPVVIGEVCLGAGAVWIEAGPDQLPTWSGHGGQVVEHDGGVFGVGEQAAVVAEQQHRVEQAQL